MKSFILNILISLGSTVLLIALFGIVIGLGSEANMGGWIESFIITVVGSSYVLFLSRGKESHLIRLIKSVTVSACVLLESYLFIVLLKSGIFFVFAPIVLIPIHKRLIDELYTRYKGDTPPGERKL